MVESTQVLGLVGNWTLRSEAVAVCCIPVYTVDFVPHCNEAVRSETSALNGEIA